MSYQSFGIEEIDFDEPPLILVVQQFSTDSNTQKKAGPKYQYMWVISLHQKRHAHPGQMTSFQNKSKYFSALQANAAILPA